MNTLNIHIPNTSIYTVVLNIFKLFSEMDYLPEKIICKFSDIKFFNFYDVSKNSHSELYWTGERGINNYFPYNFEKIIDVEWVYYMNLSKALLLEYFCKANNINLEWYVEKGIPKKYEKIFNNYKVLN